ncbi:MAG: response regulator [Gammaproteobacteria bacterium]|nr:response regulator [Gammaproteobacteria bacterium]
MNLPVAQILAVDDEGLNLMIICDLFEEVGSPYHYEITTIGNGMEAWKMLEADPERFDVILLDRMMPDMGGMEVLARIYSHPVLMHIPVIMQTACASDDEIREGISAGAYYYLTKPFNGDSLISIVQTAARDHFLYNNLRKDLQAHKPDQSTITAESFTIHSLEEVHNLAINIVSQYPGLDRILLALYELLLNAIEHGVARIGYEAKTKLIEAGGWEEEVNHRLQQLDKDQKSVAVECKRDGNSIAIEINDHGDGFDWRKYTEMSPERIYDNHGRGIALAYLFADLIEYSGNGNCVRIVSDIQGN